MPVRADDGTIYVFYRRTVGGDHRPLEYVKSTDDGASWGRPVRAIDPETFAANLHEVYVGSVVHRAGAGDRPEAFALAWTLAGGGPIGHRHDRYHKDVYFAWFRPGGDAFFTADGKSLGETVETADHPRCLVLDSGPCDPKAQTRAGRHRIGYCPLPVIGPRGEPVVVFTHSTGAADKPRQVKLARQSEQGWRVRTVRPGGFLDAAYGPEGGLWITSGAKLLVSPDGGRSWRPRAVRHPDGGPLRMIFLDDPHPDVRLLALGSGWHERSSRRAYEGRYKVWLTTPADGGRLTPTTTPGRRGRAPDRRGEGP